MAGVGFELKKIFKDDGGILNSVKGFSVTAAVTEGPMILTMVTLYANRLLLKSFNAGYRDEQIYIFIVTYVMIFSLILSNTLLMFMDRFISDSIYQRKIENILPSFFGLIFILLLAGVPVSYIYVCTLPMPLWFKTSALIQFSCMLIIWCQMAYLSAIKQYSYELIGFFAGAICSVAASLIMMRLGIYPLKAVMFATCLGFVIMMFMFMFELFAYYPLRKFDIFCFLPYLDKYKILIGIGFLMAAGLYSHNFVFWFSDFRDEIFSTGVFCTRYDVPTFFATLSIIPLLVQFVVSLETSFSKKNKTFFDTILQGGRFIDVEACKDDMIKTLYRELAHMMEIQLVFTIVAVTLIGNFLGTMGLDEQMLGTYRILCFGYCIYGVVKSIVIVLLYFDDRTGALKGAALFTGLTAGLSIVTLFMSTDLWGTGFLVGCSLAVIYLLIRLKDILDNIEYKIFCEQPLFVDESTGKFEQIKNELDEYENKWREKRDAKRK